MYKKFVLNVIIIFLFFLTQTCSAFIIRHTDAIGKSKTYVTDTVFVGTGTFLDCFISPVHWLSGVFYKQSYIHVQGANLSYPTFGGSGCFSSSYSHGNGILGAFGIINNSLFKENPFNAVYFTDTESKERALIGGGFEITRVTRKINFQNK